MYKNVSILLSTCLCMACGATFHDHESLEENLEAKAMLQGVWMDADTEEPLLKVEGDTMYYADPNLMPVAFKVIGDSLLTFGSMPLSYGWKMDNDYSLQLTSDTMDELVLRKAESVADSAAFLHQRTVPLYHEVVKKDSVVSYDGARYHGYVTVNPLSIQVTRPGMSDEGMGVDNVYYDNIIHICVYNGKRRLFSKDVTKEMLRGAVPEDFLTTAILSDMTFEGVDARGYRFQAMVGVPDGAACYLVDIIVDKNHELSYRLVQ